MFTIFGARRDRAGAVGIYGVMSFSVSQRTQEFGVRMALGANAGTHSRDGPAAGRDADRRGSDRSGLGLSLGARHRSRPTGFGTRCSASARRDPLIYVAVAALVTIVSLAATLVPARRATRVDPMYVLRME